MRDELLTLGLFCLVLLISLIFGFPLVAALLAGLVLFMTYGLTHGVRLGQVLSMAASGIWQARKILLIFFLIGSLSAVWRSSGTIASLVCYCGTLVQPSVFLLAAFLLNALISYLTGTSFGTSATMGVICMSMGTAIGVPVVATGGAILSGAFFGDRCSPVSSSALLVADVTHTDIYKNIRLMMKTAAVPLALTCVFYLVLGLILPHEGAVPDLRSTFESEFRIHPLTLLPAVAIVALSIFHVDVRLSLLAGILAGVPLCLFMQNMAPDVMLLTLIHGFAAKTPEVAATLNGGGILSMLNVAAIVCISSAYSGIFRKTKLLNGIQKLIDSVSRRVTPFAGMILTCIAASGIACNQTLAIMLGNQLCENSIPDNQQRAICLENSAVVIAPMIPWSIAGSVPLATVGAPTVSILLAVYLYLIPLYTLLVSFRDRKKEMILSE